MLRVHTICPDSVATSRNFSQHLLQLAKRFRDLLQQPMLPRSSLSVSFRSPPRLCHVGSRRRWLKAFPAFPDLTSSTNASTIAETIGRRSMTTHICIDCDSPGDGNCAMCHGSGRLSGESYSAAGDFGGEYSCSSCGGSGHCPKCGGSGELEIGGEG